MKGNTRRKDQRGDWDIAPAYYDIRKGDKLKLVKYSVYKRRYQDWEKCAYNVKQKVVIIRK